MPTGSSPWSDIFFAFLSIALEGAPYIVFGTLISGFIEAYVPARAMEKVLPRSLTLSVLISGLLGLVFPVCECAIVPVIRRLVGKGLPVANAITYMLAAPIINPITMISTVTAFKGAEPWSMVGARLGLAYLVTIIVGLVSARIPIGKILTPRLLASVSAEAPLHDHATGQSDHRVTHALRTAQKDFLETALFFAMGVFLTAVFNTKIFVHPDIQGFIGGLTQQPILSIASLMGLATVLSLCSTTDAFIAATLYGFSRASKLAFLVLGPMLDIKLLFMYTTLFQKKFLLWLVISLFFLVGLSCVIISSTWPGWRY
jgi:uncharacterized protein